MIDRPQSKPTVRVLLQPIYCYKMSKPDTLLKKSLITIANNLDNYDKQLKHLPLVLKSPLLRLGLKRCDNSCNTHILAELFTAAEDVINLENWLIDDFVLKELQKCCNLKSLNLNGSLNLASPEALMELFRVLPNLDSLHLEKCDGVTDSVLDCLRECCPLLRVLDLEKCINFTDAGLGHIAHMTLDALDISDTKIGEAGMKLFLAGPCAGTVSELQVCRCSLSCDSVRDTLCTCKKLTIFVYDGCGLIDWIPDDRVCRHISWTVNS